MRKITEKENGNIPELALKLGLTGEINLLQEFFSDWISSCDPEMREMMKWQLFSKPKYFRPITIFSCYKSITDAPLTEEVLKSAVALEMVHNISLIIDDILDRSRHRRGRLSLHCKFGSLPALMASGYLYAAANKIVVDDPYAVNLLAELMQRLGIAECVQWRLRRQPLGVEDWRMIASEDTGCMFEICAKLGTRDTSLAKYGLMLGILYHGCDDVADVRGTTSLGGGGKEDIRDGILTLPAAIAIRNPETALLFRSDDGESKKLLEERFRDALVESDAYLDKQARETAEEAMLQSSYPERLLELVNRTRALSTK